MSRFLKTHIRGSREGWARAFFSAADESQLLIYFPQAIISRVYLTFYTHNSRRDTQDGQWPILRRVGVFAQAKTPTTFLSLQITAAAGTCNAQAGIHRNSCAAILIRPLSSPLPFITEYSGAHVLEPAEEGGRTGGRTLCRLHPL